MRIPKTLKNFLHPLTLRVAVPLFYVILRVLRSTWRITTLNSGVGNARPLLVALPHCEILVGTSELIRHRHTAVLMSPSRDGALTERLVKLFHCIPLMGSSNKNPIKAMRCVIDSLEEKRLVVVTFDGPRGPALAVKPGIVFAAAVTQTPILPGVSHCSSEWRFKSWDRTRLPKPFSKVVLVYGELIDPPANTDSEEIERVRLILEQRIKELYELSNLQ